MRDRDDLAPAEVAQGLFEEILFLGEVVGPAMGSQLALLGGGHTSSKAIATAPPPPWHSPAMPRDLPRCCRACSRVTTRRAPVAPSGWPSAIAPPFTFTRSQSQSSALPLATICAAKASLISRRSQSMTDVPVFSKSFRNASSGASNSHNGSVAALA